MYYNKKRILICAHRGGCAHAPENTLLALKCAMEMGADLAELDLRVTKDENLILLHDSSLMRTTGVNKKVNTLTLAEIKQLDAGKFFSHKFVGTKIPTLSEVLTYTRGKLKILIDMKDSEGYEEIIVQLIQEFHMELDVIIGVRSVKSARRFKTLNSNIRLLGFIPTPEVVEEYLQTGVDIIRVWKDWNLPKWVSFLHEKGKPAWWCIHSGDQRQDFELFKYILKSGVDVLIVDDIIKINRWFKFL